MAIPGVVAADKPEHGRVLSDVAPEPFTVGGAATADHESKHHTTEAAMRSGISEQVHLLRVRHSGVSRNPGFLKRFLNTGPRLQSCRGRFRRYDGLRTCSELPSLIL